jgi:hypothetical protein
MAAGAGTQAGALGYRRDPGLVSLPRSLPPPRRELGSLGSAPGEGRGSAKGEEEWGHLSARRAMVLPAEPS